MKLKENVAKSFVDKSGLNFQEVRTVVDLGAWEGATPFWFSKYFPNAKVYAVEPVIESFTLLQNIIIERYLKNVIPIFSGISDHDGVQKIHMCENSRSASLLEDMAHGNDLSTRIIPVLSWDTLVDTLDIKKVDFCKVNIEGAEIELLRGMTKVFPKIMAIESHSRKIDEPKGGHEFRDKLEMLITEKGYRMKDKGKITYIVEKI